VICVALALTVFARPVCAAATNDYIADLDVVIDQVNAKLAQGKGTEKDLANELKEYDALYAKYKNVSAEVGAKVLLEKGKLYLEIFNDPVKAADLFQQIKTEFPQTKIGKQMDELLASMSGVVDARKRQDALTMGSQFPDFNVKDLSGQPLSVSEFKGKVVLINIWATWCPPCVAEMPYLEQAYAKYHDKGFEIIGISMDDDQAALEQFVVQRQVMWPQFFDGGGRDNELAVKYGVDGPPVFYLLDRTGKIIGIDRYPDFLGPLRGPRLEPAVAKALADK
jgi:thiol-disulfide isomerase/thioredoxin